MKRWAEFPWNKNMRALKVIRILRLNKDIPITTLVKFGKSAHDHFKLYGGARYIRRALCTRNAFKYWREILEPTLADIAMPAGHAGLYCGIEFILDPDL